MHSDAQKTFETLDRTLKDFRENYQPMGGNLLFFYGDFQQTLPVIPRSTLADELNAHLKASYLGRNVEKLTLSTNMCAHLLQNAARKYLQNSFCI